MIFCEMEATGVYQAEEAGGWNWKCFKHVQHDLVPSFGRRSLWQCTGCTLCRRRHLGACTLFRWVDRTSQVCALVQLFLDFISETAWLSSSY